jgi:hypothetical protein
MWLQIARKGESDAQEASDVCGQEDTRKRILGKVRGRIIENF